jgi:hypothetical protein
LRPHQRGSDEGALFHIGIDKFQGMGTVGNLRRGRKLSKTLLRSSAFGLPSIQASLPAIRQMPNSGTALQQYPRKTAPYLLEITDSTLWNAACLK